MEKTECYGTVGNATCYRGNHCMNCMMCLCGKTDCYGTVGNATCYRENLCMNCKIRCLYGKNRMLWDSG